jgi:hypothetical protein
MEENKALRSRIDNISVQLYSTAKELENDTDHARKFVGELLKEISFQLDTMVEFLD